MTVDGVPFRSRFTLRGDSLWWFAELYLHKEQAILELFRTIAAIDTLIAREQPQRLSLGERSDMVRMVALARGMPCEAERSPSPGSLARRSSAARLRWRHAVALRGGQHAQSRRARVAAFVHSAFWRADVEDGSAESYIGPVLRRSRRGSGAESIHYVGVGPRRNFQARRWWHPLAAADAGPMVPIERYAAARGAEETRRRCGASATRIRDALWSSDDIREHASIRGCDCWPIVREQLAGHRAAAVAVVGAGDGRSRRRARRASSPRSRSPTPRPAAGVARWRSSAVGAASRSPVCSTASSIATG